MIDPSQFIAELQANGIDFLCGVPDSLLKELLLVLQTVKDGPQHHIVANEGAAIAMASGYQMACGKLPLVYMQNSGLGNAVNPLMSLAHKRVYAIPMLLLIGHRGEPGKHDEPQHLAMGEATQSLLAAMKIAVYSLNDQTDASELIKEAAAAARSQSCPVAILVSSGSFSPAPVKFNQESTLTFTREEALKVLLDQIDQADSICATTGFTSRELYELRLQNKSQFCDFLNVGAMGHVSQIALGAALARPEKKIVAIDGDGSLIMHMGALAIIGQSQAGNLLHLVINNGRHESVGGQPTVGLSIDITAMAQASGYDFCTKVCDAAGLKQALEQWQKKSTAKPGLIEIQVRPGVKDKLGRPSDDFVSAKAAFSAHLQKK